MVSPKVDSAANDFSGGVVVPIEPYRSADRPTKLLRRSGCRSVLEVDAGFNLPNAFMPRQIFSALEADAAAEGEN